MYILILLIVIITIIFTWFLPDLTSNITSSNIRLIKVLKLKKDDKAVLIESTKEIKTSKLLQLSPQVDTCDTSTNSTMDSNATADNNTNK